MIVKELYAVRSDGVTLYHTYSDIGVYIMRDGVKYEDAIDPASEEREYQETNEMIPLPPIEPEPSEEDDDEDEEEEEGEPE